jgi:GT2 family glycosyltransferase
MTTEPTEFGTDQPGPAPDDAPGVVKPGVTGREAAIDTAQKTFSPMPDGGFDIAVIIPHYNDVVRLGRCLDALMARDLTGAEVVVVDNASTQSLDAIRAVHPGVRFVTEPAKGAAVARNRGVTEATAPIIAFLDCDCVPATDWLAVARRLGRDTSADIWGGRIDVFDETPPPRSGAEAFEAVFAFDWKGYIEKKGFAVTANLVTRRDVFEVTGPLINGVSEDLEWCRRAVSKGFSLQPAADLRVVHPSRSDWEALERKWRRLTRETYDLAGGNTSGTMGRAKWALKALAMPASALVHLPRVLLSPNLNGATERLRGTATLCRLRLRRMGWMLRQAAGRPI